MVSPELALVDPELRADALASLGRLEPWDFLRRRGEPRRHPELERFEFLADYGEAETTRRDTRRFVAAGAYFMSSLAKNLLFDVALFVLAVVVVGLLSLP